MNFFNEITYTILVLLLFQGCFLYLKKSVNIAAIDEFIEDLTALHLDYLSLNLTTSHRPNPYLEPVREHYQEALFRGISVGSFFQELNQILRQTQNFLHEKTKIITALMIRSLVLTFLCIVARVGLLLLHGSSIHTDWYLVDGLAMGGSLLVHFVFHRVVFVCYPNAWFWDLGLTATAKD